MTRTAWASACASRQRMARPFALRLVASEAGFKRRGPMSVALEVLARQFLHSPPSDRAHLLSRVMASLDSGSGIDSKWVVLTAQREADPNADPTQPVPWHEALARARAAVARRVACTGAIGLISATCR